MAKKTAKQIVEEAMPGVKVLPAIARPADEAAPGVPAGQSAQELQSKYMGTPTASQPTTSDSADTARSTRGASAATSSIDELRRRFLGTGAAGGSATVPAPGAVLADASDADDVEIVRVQSRSEADNAEPGPGVRSVIVSKSKGKIIGKQG